MSTMTQKTTRVTEAQGKLIDEFKAHVNIDALVKAVATQSQLFENAAFEVLLNTLIATAVGVQLDLLGDIVGVERQGLSDADYRVRIGAQILLNNSSGTIPELIDLGLALGIPNGTLILRETFPAKIELETTTVLSNGLGIGLALADAKSAGVGFAFTWHESLNPFLFDTVGQGFDDGELGEMISA